MLNTVNLPTVVVIPCLNEQDVLADACKSLGFGLGKQFEMTNKFLFIVDNGSTDGTLDIAKEIQYNSPCDMVFIGHEVERGYIPPRHKGNLLAKELAKSFGWKDEDVFILQADADTMYSVGYLDAMRSASYLQGPGVLIESCSEYPPTFVKAYPRYIEACGIADQPFAKWFNDNMYDVVVDDKTCGYRLQDYLDWGGHVREYDLDGEEIYAETTRLYIRAIAAGARRFRLETATAYHSIRKVLENPLLELATTGFPRAVSWKTKWLENHKATNTITEICANLEHPEVQRAINIRRRHTIALFGVLPLHIAQTLNEDLVSRFPEFIKKLASMLPKRNQLTLSSHPGAFLTDVLYQLDQYDDTIVNIIAKQMANEEFE